VFSEYSLMNPMCWELVRPILAANGGWAAFIFTPRGYNHAWDLYDMVKEDPEWHVSLLDNTRTFREDGSAIVTDEMIEQQVKEGMPEELARQEFKVDWSAPMTGAYYGKQMDAAEREGRIKELAWDRDEKVYTFWDLGVRDTMVVWFAQIIDGWVHVIDYLAHSGEGIEWYAKELDKKPYVYAKHYAPHDVRKRELGTGVSVYETAWKLGLHFTIVPQIGVENGINAVRLALPKCRFDREKCSHGLAALRQYSKTYDPKNKVWSKPLHNWASHSADSFRYGAVMLPTLTKRVGRPVRWESQLTWDEVMGIHDKTVMNRRRAESREFARL
jgi:hypothetical protein